MILRSVLSGVLLCGACFAQDSSQSPANGANPPSAQPSAGQHMPPQASPSQTPPSQTPTSQSSAAGQAQAGAVSRIAPGSVIPVELTKSIDAKKAKTGDQVEAKVTQDLKNGNGDIIVAKDTRVIGHVTEAQARNKQQKESQMTIAFDHAVMKSGGDLQMPLSIQAVIGPRRNSDNPTEDNQNQSRPATGNAGAGMPAGNGRAGGMGSGTTSASSDTPNSSAGTAAADSKSAGNQGQVDAPITGETKGVVGISDLKLSSAAGPAQGSMLSSEKNNVKLESGTLMLLKVSQ